MIDDKCYLQQCLEHGKHNAYISSGFDMIPIFKDKFPVNLRVIKLTT